MSKPSNKPTKLLTADEALVKWTANLHDMVGKGEALVPIPRCGIRKTFSSVTVMKWIKGGRLPALRISGRFYSTDEAIAGYLFDTKHLLDGVKYGWGAKVVTHALEAADHCEKMRSARKFKVEEQEDVRLQLEEEARIMESLKAIDLVEPEEEVIV